MVDDRQLAPDRLRVGFGNDGAVVKIGHDLRPARRRIMIGHLVDVRPVAPAPDAQQQTLLGPRDLGEGGGAP